MGRNIGGIAVACCCDGFVLPQVAHLEVLTHLQAVPGDTSLRSFIATIPPHGVVLLNVSAARTK